MAGDEAAKVREGHSEEENSLEALDALRSEEQADEDAVIYMTTITHSYREDKG